MHTSGTYICVALAERVLKFCHRQRDHLGLPDEEISRAVVSRGGLFSRACVRRGSGFGDNSGTRNDHYPLVTLSVCTRFFAGSIARTPYFTRVIATGVDPEPMNWGLRIIQADDLPGMCGVCVRTPPSRFGAKPRPVSGLSDMVCERGGGGRRVPVPYFFGCNRKV